MSVSERPLGTGGSTPPHSVGVGSRHVTVCICTLQRPELLRRLLQKLEQQRTQDRFVYSIVVADNDARRSAETVVTEFAAKSPVEVTYCSEQRRNIALARNKALEQATGDFVAFIDDDEFPEQDWLLRMLDACEAYCADGMLGPVRPHFDEVPPPWILRGRFFERPEHRTGRVVDWQESRTGNVLFRRTILHGLRAPFDPRFGTGGEDKDFFMRMTQAGHVFRWCNEAVVYEAVPPGRWTRRYMLKRALLRGKNILKHPTGRARLVARSVIAAPAYTLLLPFTWLFGQHVWMTYCIKVCDHAGRVLALLRLNPIRGR